MSLNKQAALKQLAALLGVDERKAVPKDMAGRVLMEIADAMTGHVAVRDDEGKPTFDIQHGVGGHADPRMALPGKSTPPKGSEVEKLASYLSGTDLDQPSTGNVNAEPSMAMQQAIDKAVARALTKHGINPEPDDE